MRHITNTCKSCGEKFEFDAQEVGREWTCPHCNAAITLCAKRQLFDWQKWLIIWSFSFAIALIKSFIHPFKNLNPISVPLTYFGSLVGTALVPFVGAMVIAVFIKGRAGVVIGISIVTIVYLITFLGESL